MSLLFVIGALYNVHGEHYTFRKLGHAVFSSDLAHLSVPIDITQLAPLMSHAQNLTQHLHIQAKTHGNQAGGAGAFLKTMATYANENFLNLHAKYENILYFHTRHVSISDQFEPASNSPTQSDSYQTFILRRKPVGEILSTTTAAPSSNPSSNDVRVERSIDSTNYDPLILEPYHAPSGSPPPSRPKRFIGTIVASLLTSIGVSSIFGAMNSAQLDTLREGLRSTDTRQQLLIHAIDENSNHIATNRAAVSQLAELTERIISYTTVEHWRSAGQFVYILVETEMGRLNAALDQFLEIIQAATSHRFHHTVLTKEGATIALNEIKNLARSRGLVPVINNPQQFSQLETSYMLTDNGINLVIHLPLASDETTFSIYKYNSLPIMIGTKVFARIQPRNEILAVGQEESNGHPRYLEISSYDLDLCLTLGDVYICKNQQIFNRPSQSTCLYSLFIGSHETARDECELELEHKRYDQVVSIGSDEFLYYAATPSSFEFECQNRSIIRGHQLTAVTKIKIPPFCKVKTKSFILNRENDLYKQENPLKWAWTLPPLTFLANDTSIKDLNSAMEKLAKIKGLPKITPQTVERIKLMNRPFYKKPFPLISFMVALTGLILVLLLFIVIAYRAYQARKTRLQTQNPTFRFKELIKSHENVEAIVTLLQQRATNSPNGPIVL